MKIRHSITTLVIIIATLFLPSNVSAETVVLSMPAGGIDQHKYFYELLSTALKEAGHQPVIERVTDFPHLRTRDMLEHGAITLCWLVRSKKRDEIYIPVPVNLTNGLIGKRILLVAPNNADLFARTKTLDDFRKTKAVGGFGTNWFDTHLWKYNRLPYREVANPKLIYDMIAAGDRELDYFSRGFNEVVQEAEDNPNVIIEPHIMLEYDRDFIFYLTPKRPELVPILTDALNKARESGLMDSLILKHWAKNFDIIKPETRRIIRIDTPD